MATTDLDENKSDISKFTRRTAIVIGMLTVVVAVAVFTYKTLGVLLLLFLGVLFALFLDMIAGFLSEHTPASRPLALGAAVIILFGLFGAFSYFVAPALGSQLAQLFERIPAGVDAAQEWLKTRAWGGELAAMADGQSVAEMISPTRLKDAVFATFGAFGDTLFVIVIGLYLAVDPGVYRCGIVSLIPPEGRERAGELLTSVWGALRRWLLGQLGAMAVVGVLFGVGLGLLGVNLAFALGIIAGLFAFVPIVGSAVAVLPALAVAVSQSTDLALWVFLLYLGIQFVESYFLTPMIQKKAVDMPPVLLLTAQVVMYLLGGALGVIVATPITLVVVFFVRELYIGEFLGAEPVTAT